MPSRRSAVEQGKRLDESANVFFRREATDINKKPNITRNGELVVGPQPGNGVWGAGLSPSADLSCMQLARPTDAGEEERRCSRPPCSYDMLGPSPGDVGGEPGWLILPCVEQKLFAAVVRESEFTEGKVVNLFSKRFPSDCFRGLAQSLRADIFGFFKH